MADEKGIFGAEGAPQSGERKPELVTPLQRPMEVRTAEYVETGYVPVAPAPDGGVLIGGGDPPGPALMLTTKNLVCTEDPSTGREACSFFVELLTEAEGVTKGFGDQPKQIRCFCTRLSTASELMEIGEIAVFACSARSPVDVTSSNLIRGYRQRQRDLATEHAQEKGERDL